MTNLKGIKGTARTTPEGEVRWTTYSIFSGQERWKSEGIQIGGRRSAKGVVGNWFEKYALNPCRFSCTISRSNRDYDPHGPCGPTAFWKISDREPRSDDHQVELNDFLPLVDGYEQDPEQDDGYIYDSDDGGDQVDDESEDVEVFLPVDIEYIEIDG